MKRFTQFQFHSLSHGVNIIVFSLFSLSLKAVIWIWIEHFVFDIYMRSKMEDCHQSWRHQTLSHGWPLPLKCLIKPWCNFWLVSHQPPTDTNHKNHGGHSLSLCSTSQVSKEHTISGNFSTKYVKWFVDSHPLSMTLYNWIGISIYYSWIITFPSQSFFLCSNYSTSFSIPFSHPILNPSQSSG